MLTTLKIKNAAPQERAYKLADAAGLYLLVEPTGSKKWRFKFRFDGKEQLMSLGRFPEVGLAEAREALHAARKQLLAGLNPIAARRLEREQHRVDTAHHARRKFQTVMASWIERRASELRISTLTQTKRELARYITPKFGERDIDSLTRPELTQFVQDVQRAAPETARNLRGHLHNICEHAIDMGVLDINPAPPGRVLGRRRNTHHPALPARELGSLLRKLEASTTIYERTHNAMLLLILTACRKQEVTAARWDEIDLKKATWKIPAARMKAKRPHFVPLSKQAVQVLGGMLLLNQGMNSEFVFPHRDRPNKPMDKRVRLDQSVGVKVSALTAWQGHPLESVYSVVSSALWRKTARPKSRKRVGLPGTGYAAQRVRIHDAIPVRG